MGTTGMTAAAHLAAAGAATAPRPPQTPEAMVTADVDARRSAEAKIACIALGTAAVLSLIRAAILPLILSSAPKEKFASFVSPDAQLAAWILAGVFAIACCFAPRRPLHASVAALVCFLLWAVPDVAHNPVLVGGGHIGKLVTLGILARAAFAGVMHRLLDYERA
jgi:hypothetical protein